MRISDWSSDVCSSDLAKGIFAVAAAGGANTLGKVALGAASSIGLAMVAAFAGIWLGLRKQLKGAIDDEERTALIRSSVINGLASIAFVACMLLVASGARRTVMLVATIAAWPGFLAVLFYPTIVGPRRPMRRPPATE